MKKLLFLSAACWLAACEGPIFGSKKAPTFVIESPYADAVSYTHLTLPTIWHV